MLDGVGQARTHVGPVAAADGVDHRLAQRLARQHGSVDRGRGDPVRQRVDERPVHGEHGVDFVRKGLAPRGGAALGVMNEAAGCARTPGAKSRCSASSAKRWPTSSGTPPRGGPGCG
jgi:hypothetical protein